MPKDLAKYDDTGPDEKMAAVIATLQSEADRRVTRRVIIEKRWIDDLRNYHGQMSPSERQRFTDNPGSQVNVNITRPKTNAIIARMFDLLFPTDDRNWSIAPTPVPEMKQQEELTSVADDAQRSIAEITSQMEDAAREPGTDEKLQALDQEKKTLDSTMSEARMAADALYETLQDARDRANLMQEEIADQLTECSYEAAAREAITDGCTVGCGVLKGPVLGTSLRRRWKEGENGFEMMNDAEDKPGVQHVKPWGFFPDPDVKNPGDGKGVYERHLLSPTQLKRFARRDDVDKDAVRRLLKAKAKGSLDGHMAELFDLTGQQQAMRADTFHLWEYTGPIEAEDLATIVEGIADTGVKAGIIKCATDAKGLTPGVERVLRACARAHRETGVPITTHTDAGTFRGRDQQQVFLDEGVDLSRVVIGHCGDSTDVDYLRELMDQGSTIGMDRFGLDLLLPFEDRVDTVARLCEQGYGDRMVLAHDAACYMDWFDMDLQPVMAPNWHYNHISDDVLPALRERGVGDDQIQLMLVENPRRILAGGPAY